ncbi:hypothetical protein BST81_03840 [Leptolyngbya sp. 'hensonii']|nr:hypothetical protein BST81_03840 [Leptolyngbya sp. 'hensonii']
MNRIVLSLSIFFGLTLTASALPPNYTLWLKANSTKCLQKMNPSWENGNPIHLWDCGVERNNESWVYDVKTGQIRAKANPAKCLQKKEPGWENGNPIHLWDCGVDRDNESWVYDVKTGQIRAKANPSKCLQKKEPGWENGNPIHLWDCGVDRDNESWQNTIFAGAKAEVGGTYQNSITVLNRAKNYARQAAEKRNGGLQNYRAEDKMHGPADQTGVVENDDGSVTFTFYGGKPTAEPTIESVVTVEINGWQTRIDYNGPIRR